jgi:hypothetical protein
MSEADESHVAQREAETYIAQLRKAHTPMQLYGQDRQAVVTWYNLFVDFLKTYRVPIKIFDKLQVSRLEDPDEHIYPRALETDPHLCNRFGAAIYAKLEEDQVLDPDNQLYMGLLRIHNSNRVGYTMLKSILAATLLTGLRNIGVLSTPPIAAIGVDAFAHAACPKEFFGQQAQLERNYRPKEQAMIYLQVIQRTPTYTAAATQLLYDLEQIRVNVQLPLRFRLPQLPVALVTHQGVLPAPERDAHPKTLNVTQSHPSDGPRDGHVSLLAPQRTPPPRYRHGPRVNTGHRHCGEPGHHQAPM